MVVGPRQFSQGRVTKDVTSYNGRVAWELNSLPEAGFYMGPAILQTNRRVKLWKSP